MCDVSPWRIGIFDSSDTAGSIDCGELRLAPLGVPVVPEVRMIALPISSGGTGASFEPFSISSSRVGSSRSSESCQPMKRLRRSAASDSRSVNSSSNTIPTGFSRLTTSVSCGPANAVFRYSAWAPSLAIATVASMKPRWLRHMIATPSPSLMPASAKELESAFVRSSISRQVSVPRSSTTAGSSGWMTAPVMKPAAGLRPQRASVIAALTSLSGRTGRMTPASTSTLRLPNSWVTDPTIPFPCSAKLAPSSIGCSSISAFSRLRPRPRLPPTSGADMRSTSAPVMPPGEP